MSKRIPEPEYNELLAEFRSLCLETKTPAVFGRWDLSVQDISGNVVDHRNFSSQSWTRNYYNERALEFLSIVGTDAGPFGTGAINFMLVDGSLRQVDITGVQGLQSGILTGIDGFGILVGSGSKAEDFDDPTFDTQIVHGKAAGELFHYGMGVDASLVNITWDSDNRIFTRTAKRAFLNDSGGSVTVREIGIVPVSGFANGDFMNNRDVLDSDLAIPDVNILIATYFMESVVFPA
jgi:hypothetical protein